MAPSEMFDHLTPLRGHSSFGFARPRAYETHAQSTQDDSCEAWNAIESELIATVSRPDIETNHARRPAAVSQILRQQHVINSELADVLDRLRNLSNFAAHPAAGIVISPEEAFEHVALSEWAVSALRLARES